MHSKLLRGGPLCRGVPITPQDNQISRVILIEGLANLGVLLAKLAVGLSTGSLVIFGGRRSFTG